MPRPPLLRQGECPKQRSLALLLLYRHSTLIVIPTEVGIQTYWKTWFPASARMTEKIILRYLSVSGNLTVGVW